MPYSELANWNGSLDESSATPTPVRNSSPQRGEESSCVIDLTAEDCAGSREGDEDEAGGKGGRTMEDGEYAGATSTFTFTQRVRGSVFTAMKKRKHKAANVGRGRGSKREILDEIVVKRYRPSRAKVEPSARVAEQDAGPSTRDKAGPSSSARKTDSHVSSPNVKHTYAGPRKIKGIPVSSRLNDSSSSRPTHDGSLRTALIPRPETDARPDRGGSVGLSLRGRGSSYVSAYKDLRSSATSKSISLPPTSKRDIPTGSSRNSYQASLSSIINSQKNLTLGKTVRREKAGKKRRSLVRSQSSPDPPQPPAARPRYFDGVSITTPSSFTASRRGLYKSLEEYEAEEDAEGKMDQGRGMQKGEPNKDVYGKHEPIKSASQKPSTAETICASSDGEEPVAGSSKSASKAHSHSPSRTPGIEYKGVEVFPADASSGDELVLSGTPFRKVRAARTKAVPKSSSSPRTAQKRNPQREQLLLSYEDSSGPEVDFCDRLLPLVTTRSPPIQSPGQTRTPSTITPEQRATEDVANRDTELEIRIEIKDNDKQKTDVVSSFLVEDSFAGESRSGDKHDGKTSTLPEIVVEHSTPASRDTMQGGSPTRPSSSLAWPAHSSPSSRSTTLAVREPKYIKEASIEYPGEETEESSSDEEDNVCHHCRSRNVYAKMKCRKVKQDRVCPLYFCHRCIVVLFPKIEFDPYSVSFTCPVCDGTCRCDLCCVRRGATPQSRRRGPRWNKLGVTFLLSEQETRRQERRERALVAGRLQEQTTKRRRRPKGSVNSRGANEPKATEGSFIGAEAEDWLNQQRAALRKTGKTGSRAFVGAWQDGWGHPPTMVHVMDGVSLDIHAVIGSGKGKEKAVDPGIRLVAGDERMLRRPFLRAADVTVFERESSEKPVVKGRKPAGNNAMQESIYVTSKPPVRKKRRVKKLEPEFTLNHLDGASPSASPSLQHLTPTDAFSFPGLQPDIMVGGPRAPLRYKGVMDDPMLGVIDPALSSDGLGGDMYAPDWDSVGMKPYEPTVDGPDFSYQGTYDSYAAALGGAAGMDGYESTFGYGYDMGDVVVISPQAKDKADGQVVNAGATYNYFAKEPTADAKQLGGFEIIDPALLEQEQNNTTKVVGQGLEAEDDPMRFLTLHARASSRLIPVPIIYGMPSSTGLSLQDLERTVKDSLSALRS